MTAAQQPLDLLEGTLEQVLFVNDDSGYAVAILQSNEGNGVPGRRITVVGSLAGIEVGTGLRAHGRFESHPRHGEQFRVDDFETVRPATLAALEKYLASEIKGIGRRLAARITAHFGERLHDVLDSEPLRLREVRGISRNVADRVAAAWRDASGLRELTVFLRGLGISAVHSRRIHRVYGASSLAVIKRDPYVLARQIEGIGFRTADSAAARLGVPRNSIERARAAIAYLLERMAEDGHVYAPLEHLQRQFSTALEMGAELVDPALAELEKTGDVVTDSGAEGQPAVYIARLHQAETELAKRLRNLSGAMPPSKDAIARGLAAAFKAAPQLSSEQREALRCALASKVTVITGGPGTGKTTLLRSLLVALDAVGITPALCAPTGRAARRLAEAAGRDAKTIHRLLEYAPESGAFVRGPQFPLRTSHLIVDEASMMDLELASSLVAALVPGCALLLVGDRDQLPSVGPGSVLKDVIASGLAPVVELREVYRQARESLIVANAHRINRGLMPEISNRPEADFFFIERTVPGDVVETIKQVVRDRLIGKFGIEQPREIQVITPMNRGPIGTHALNDELQQLLNPAGRSIRSGDRTLRIDDRVIQLRNNYDKQVFNGEIGRIVAIDSERGQVTVGFDESRAIYDQSEMHELALAYAISVHKSQGSQYPAVVMPLHQSHYVMLRRNLLYTAITRAERVCVLIGTRSALALAVRNEEERRRFSRLAERLRVD